MRGCVGGMELEGVDTGGQGDRFLPSFRAQPRGGEAGGREKERRATANGLRETSISSKGKEGGEGGGGEGGSGMEVEGGEDRGGGGGGGWVWQ